jgi:hypothetical protein
MSRGGDSTSRGGGNRCRGCGGKEEEARGALGRRKMEGAGRRSDQRGLSAGPASGGWAQGQRIAVVVASFIRGGIRDLGRMVHGTGEATLTLGGANAPTRNQKSFLEQCETVLL